MGGALNAQCSSCGGRGSVQCARCEAELCRGCFLHRHALCGAAAAAAAPSTTSAGLSPSQQPLAPSAACTCCQDEVDLLCLKCQEQLCRGCFLAVHAAVGQGPCQQSPSTLGQQAGSLPTPMPAARLVVREQPFQQEQSKPELKVGNLPGSSSMHVEAEVAGHKAGKDEELELQSESSSGLSVDGSNDSDSEACSVDYDADNDNCAGNDVGNHNATGMLSANPLSQQEECKEQGEACEELDDSSTACTSDVSDEKQSNSEPEKSISSHSNDSDADSGPTRSEGGYPEGSSGWTDLSEWEARGGAEVPSERVTSDDDPMLVDHEVGVNDNSQDTAQPKQATNGLSAKRKYNHRQSNDSHEGNADEKEVLAVEEIRKYQSSTDPLINCRAFRRLVREVACGAYVDAIYPVDFTAKAYEAIQCAAEAYLVSVFERANSMALHAQREKILPEDMQLSKQSNRWSYYS
eukprot:jgi/Chlat1/547/Chrsp103S00999